MLPGPDYNAGHMAQEINLGGTIYISSKKAAEITGYTQDYIGQLARGGQIVAQRVSGLWYIVEESLRNYKQKADEFVPVPPPVVRQEPQIESSVSFDGRDYVSTQRAAEITGYHADYVGQLARTGKVLSRQVGSRWFVDREAVVEHKRHNDALLAAVQAESVGLMKDAPPVPLAEASQDLHFNYTAEESSPASYLPEIDDTSRQESVDHISVADEPVNEIPIRVIRPATEARMPRPDAHFEHSITRYRSSQPVTIIISATILGLFVLGGGYLYFFNRPGFDRAFTASTNAVQGAAAAVPFERLNNAIEVPGFLTNELYYRRDAF
jgi:hypothetical protein